MHLSRVKSDANPDQVSNRNIVIVGKSGAGKSSLANTIFGEEVFKIEHSPNSGTNKCQAKTKSVNGRSITLIDTPGFFDTGRSEKEMKPEIVRCITECAPGPHAFLIVLKVENFTEQEQAVIDKISKYFSEEIYKYATVLFTHGDQIPEGKTIEDYVRQNKPLSDLVKKCGGRCHVIDNKYWNKEHEYRSNQIQVEELLKTIDRMVRENKGGYYTNEMLQAVEEEIHREEEQIRLSSGNMSEKEIREQAKVRVSTKLSSRSAGVLLRALSGVAAMVGGFVRDIILTIVSQTLAYTSGASAASGAGMIRVAGYHAAEGANTPQEAAKRTAEAVKDGTEYVEEETHV